MIEKNTVISKGTIGVPLISIIISGGIIMSVLLSACKSKKKIAPPLPAYLVMEIHPRATTLFTDYPATIQGQQNVEIRPKVDGFIETIYVDEGTSVKKGQLLFRIKAPQYEQEVRTSQAAILIAQADVDAAQMQVNKVRPLVEKNIISKYELEGAEYSLKSRQAALAQSNARLANAQTNLSYTVIASPVNGVTGSIPYKSGSLVSATSPQPLTTVSNNGNIYAYFSVNEKTSLEFAKNTKGATAKERMATLPPVSLILANGSEFSEKGTIDAASGLINTETGSVNVRATFPNPGNIVRSGSSGTIRIPQHTDTAILIPQKVTYEIQGKLFVYVTDSSGTVRSTGISVQSGGNGKFFVVKNGLHTGDRIVIEGIETLREGLVIRPNIARADSVYQEILQ